MLFTARWFQTPAGRYLSLDESDASVRQLTALDKESAIELAKEYESEDSVIPFNDRVLVYSADPRSDQN